MFELSVFYIFIRCSFLGPLRFELVRLLHFVNWAELGWWLYSVHYFRGGMASWIFCKKNAKCVICFYAWSRRRVYWISLDVVEVRVYTRYFTLSLEVFRFFLVKCNLFTNTAQQDLEKKPCFLYFVVNVFMFSECVTERIFRFSSSFRIYRNTTYFLEFQFKITVTASIGLCIFTLYPYWYP